MNWNEMAFSPFDDLLIMLIDFFRLRPIQKVIGRAPKFIEHPESVGVWLE